MRLMDWKNNNVCLIRNTTNFQLIFMPKEVLLEKRNCKSLIITSTKYFKTSSKTVKNICPLCLPTVNIMTSFSHYQSLRQSTIFLCKYSKMMVIYGKDWKFSQNFCFLHYCNLISLFQNFLKHTNKFLSVLKKCITLWLTLI